LLYPLIFIDQNYNHYLLEIDINMVFVSLLGYIYHQIRGDYLPKLIKNGLILGKNVFLGTDVSIDTAYPWLISIGDDCTLTERVTILAHDASTFRHTGYTKVGKVTIGRKTFIGVGCIVLPGVTIGENVIIGSGSVVTKNIPDNSVVAGNPARIIGSTSDYVERHKKNMEHRPVFKELRTQGSEITNQNKKIMNEKLQDGIGYNR